jgi:hypothetical protein
MAIDGNRWQSMAINGHQQPSAHLHLDAAIKQQSMAINGNQWQSMAINGNQWQSMAIKSHQRTSISTPRRIGAEPNACATSAAWSTNGRIPQAGGWASLSLGPLCLATTSASAASN